MGIILTESPTNTVPAMLPPFYSVTRTEGREQPYTLWFDRVVTNKKRVAAVRREVVAFCRTWYETLRRAYDDDPDEEVLG